MSGMPRPDTARLRFGDLMTVWEENAMRTGSDSPDGDGAGAVSPRFEAGLYRELFHATSDALLVLDEDGTIVDANPAAARMHGRPAETMLGLNRRALVDPDRYVPEAELLRRCAENGGRYTSESLGLRPDGSRFDVEMHVVQFTLGGRQHLLLAARDISDRKRVVRALRESSEMLRLVMDNIPLGIFWKDRESVYLGCNRAFARDAGYSSPGQVVGLTDYDLAWRHEEADFFRRVDKLVMSEDRPAFHIIEPQLQADGKQAWLDTSKIPLHDEKGNVVGVLGMYEDITERKVAEEKLRESEERFRGVFEQASAGMALVDFDGHIQRINQRMCDILGYERHELEQLTVEQITHPDDKQREREQIKRMLDGELSTYEMEKRYIRRDGSIVHCDLSVSFVRDTEGDARYLIGVVTDISDRKLAEEKVRESEERFRRLSRAAFEGILIHAMGRVIDANETLARMFGYEHEEVLNLDAYLLAAPESRDLVRRHVREGYEQAYEAMGIRKDGTRFPTELIGRSIPHRGREARVVAIRDITDRKEAEETIRDREARLRLMIEQMPAIMWTTDRDLRFTSSQGTALQQLGLAPNETVGTTLHEFFGTEDESFPPIAAHRRALAGESVEYETTWHGRTYATHVEPLQDVAGQIIGSIGIALDMTERTEAEREVRARVEAEQLLLRELDHRVRNNLASLIALLDLSSESTVDARALVHSVRTRVQAMATVHALLSRSHWEPVRLKSLFGALIPPDRGGTVELSGVDVGISATQAQAMGMVINELMINSLKYGALGVEQGRVRISWEMHAEEDAARRLLLRWQDVGGPPIENEPEPGVGTGLLRGLVKSELHGSAELTYPREGVSHTLEIALDEPVMHSAPPRA
jgi:PAS domain S-box-containing protein